MLNIYVKGISMCIINYYKRRLMYLHPNVESTDITDDNEVELLILLLPQNIYYAQAYYRSVIVSGYLKMEDQRLEHFV